MQIDHSAIELMLGPQAGPNAVCTQQPSDGLASKWGASCCSSPFTHETRLLQHAWSESLEDQCQHVPMSARSEISNSKDPLLNVRCPLEINQVE